MHIPDGYLSPATCAAFYAAATPFWAVAAVRVKKILSGRTVPLLAIFSAFSFAIMMFNVPVPGGTTAHGVGGTLTAIILGPWAAVISTSVALMIQALFFGDGGILSIGANCFNMGVVLPMVGYFSYRAIAGNSDPFSQRRVIAAAIGSYLGITAAALAVGLELGLQPEIASTNGVPDYSPYGFGTAIPSMLVSHMAGASFVEAAITALSIAYMQTSFPEILTRGEKRPEAVAVAERSGQSVGRVRRVHGGGADRVRHRRDDRRTRPRRQVGMDLDWNTVSWRTPGRRSLVSAAVSAIVLPLIYLVLKGFTGAGVRTVTMVFAGLIIWAPIGLIAPGGAFAEESTASQEEVTAAIQARAAGDPSLFEALPDINQDCECVPTKIEDVTLSNDTLLAGYEPPWVSANDPAWQQNLGYQVAAIAGFAMVGFIGLLLYQFGALADADGAA